MLEKPQALTKAQIAHYLQEKYLPNDPHIHLEDFIVEKDGKFMLEMRFPTHNIQDFESHFDEAWPGAHNHGRINYYPKGYSWRVGGDGTGRNEQYGEIHTWETGKEGSPVIKYISTANIEEYTAKLTEIGRDFQNYGRHTAVDWDIIPPQESTYAIYAPVEYGPHGGGKLPARKQIGMKFDPNDLSLIALMAPEESRRNDARLYAIAQQVSAVMDEHKELSAEDKASILAAAAEISGAAPAESFTRYAKKNQIAERT